MVADSALCWQVWLRSLFWLALSFFTPDKKGVADHRVTDNSRYQNAIGFDFLWTARRASASVGLVSFFFRLSISSVSLCNVASPGDQLLDLAIGVVPLLN